LLAGSFAGVLFISGIASLVGLGGGVLYVPLLLALGLSFSNAAATSLVAIIATSASASVSYYRRHRIDWRLLLTVEPPSFGGAFAGGLFAGHISDFVLKIVFSGVLMVICYLMLRPPVAETSMVDPSGPAVLASTPEESSYHARLPQLMSFSALAGGISGMIGIAGGTLKIPIMVLVGGVPIGIAVGTSAAMVGMTAAAGLAGHLASGHFSLLLLLPVVIAALLGGQIGSRFSLRMKFSRLRRVFAFILLLVSLIMLVEALL
jgi:hypothetical protein